MTDAVAAACGDPDILLPSSESPVVQKAAGQSTTRVRLQCKDDQWCDFPCTAAPGATVKGTPVPPKELERWIAWQSYADPIEGMKRIDTYSNWVLGAGGIVVLLTSGLVSNTTLPQFETTAARWLFGMAVAALGLSWVFISFVKAPAWGSLNRHSPPDYLRAFNHALRRRRRLFAFAASLLGLSLTLAALIPLGQTLKRPADPPRIVFTYSWAADSAYTAEVHGEGLPPHSPIEVMIRKDAPTSGILPVQRKRADAKGVGTAAVEVPAARKLDPPFRMVGRWREAHGDSTRWVADSVTFPLATRL